MVPLSQVSPDLPKAKSPRRKQRQGMFYAKEGSIPFLQKVSRLRGGVTQPGFPSLQQQEEQQVPGSPIPGPGCTDSPQVSHCPHELKMELPRASDSCRGRIWLLFWAFFTPQSWS